LCQTPGMQLNLDKVFEYKQSLDEKLPCSIPDLLHKFSWLWLACRPCSISVLLKKIEQGLINLVRLCNTRDTCEHQTYNTRTHQADTPSSNWSAHLILQNMVFLVPMQCTFQFDDHALPYALSVKAALSAGVMNGFTCHLQNSGLLVFGHKKGLEPLCGSRYLLCPCIQQLQCLREKLSQGLQLCYSVLIGYLGKSLVGCRTMSLRTQVSTCQQQ